jgi:hypothetical protein
VRPPPRRVILLTGHSYCMWLYPPKYDRSLDGSTFPGASNHPSRLQGEERPGLIRSQAGQFAAALLKHLRISSAVHSARPVRAGTWMTRRRPADAFPASPLFFSMRRTEHAESPRRCSAPRYGSERLVSWSIRAVRPSPPPRRSAPSGLCQGELEALESVTCDDSTFQTSSRLTGMGFM